MRAIQIIKRYARSPRKAILTLGSRGAFNWLPDRQYLKLAYWSETGERLNLKEPATFNEKIQWLKLNDRNPEYNVFVDKYAVRQHIRNTIGEEYLIPLIAVYDRVEEINWDALPNKFVLKCTHGSNCNVICADKNKLDIPSTIQKLNKWMKKNWYWFGREWPYKDVQPRIIFEQYMVDESGTQLKDYKIFCFNGEPQFIQVDYDRFINHKRNLYDPNWSYINASINYATDASVTIKKPEKLEVLLKLAQTLAVDYPHVRVDFYYINGQIYFGELTFYHGSGYEKFHPKEFGEKIGALINLPY